MVENPDVLVLEDFIVRDPFQNIYQRKKDGEPHFFYVHTDYLQYLQYLNIIWNRLREEYKTIAIYHRKSLELLSKHELSDEQNLALNNVNMQTVNTLRFVQCDIETFILFTRRFLDKVAKLVESVVILKPPGQIGNSFSDHKTFFIDNEMYNPTYSRLLREETNWYEQDLLIWRDGIFVHGKTLNTGALISSTRGIQLRKAIGVYQISEKDKKRFVKIKEKYENRYRDLKITENPFMMIDEFREETSKLNIKLDKEDLDELKQIVSRTGSTLDISKIAKNVTNFVEQTASIFDN